MCLHVMCSVYNVAMGAIYLRPHDLRHCLVMEDVGKPMMEYSRYVLQCVFCSNITPPLYRLCSHRKILCKSIKYFKCVHQTHSGARSMMYRDISNSVQGLGRRGPQGDGGMVAACMPLTPRHVPFHSCNKLSFFFLDAMQGCQRGAPEAPGQHCGPMVCGPVGAVWGRFGAGAGPGMSPEGMQAQGWARGGCACVPGLHCCLSAKAQVQCNAMKRLQWGGGPRKRTACTGCLWSGASTASTVPCSPWKGALAASMTKR